MNIHPDWDYNVRMSNILDYLAWRGDLSLTQDPFNSIDALVLSCLSYVDFTGVVPAEDNALITVEEASERFFTLHSAEELAQDKSFIRFAPDLLRAMARTDRFKNAYILNFVDDTDISRGIQFAAVEIDLSDGTAFISFRGTDDTVVGWKEDFNLSFMTVPSEMEAVRYLRKVTDGRQDKIRLGGHSKGGHLAIFAATTADPETASRIDHVYSFDGPGFNH